MKAKNCQKCYVCKAELYHLIQIYPRSMKFSQLIIVRNSSTSIQRVQNAVVQFIFHLFSNSCIGRMWAMSQQELFEPPVEGGWLYTLPTAANVWWSSFLFYYGPKLWMTWEFFIIWPHFIRRLRICLFCLAFNEFLFLLILFIEFMFSFNLLFFIYIVVVVFLIHFLLLSFVFIILLPTKQFINFICFINKHLLFLLFTIIFRKPHSTINWLICGNWIMFNYLLNQHSTTFHNVWAFWRRALRKKLQSGVGLREWGWWWWWCIPCCSCHLCGYEFPSVTQ